MSVAWTHLYAFCRDATLGKSSRAFAATNTCVTEKCCLLTPCCQDRQCKILRVQINIKFWSFVRLSPNLQNSMSPQGVSLLSPMWRILPALCAAASASSCSSSGTELYAFSGWYRVSPNIGTYLQQPSHYAQRMTDVSPFCEVTHSLNSDKLAGCCQSGQLLDISMRLYHLNVHGLQTYR